MSGLAYLVDALGGFAGGLSQALQQNQGQNDLGNALASLYGGAGGASGSGGGGLGSLVGMPASSGQGGQNGAYSYQGQTATNLPSAGPSMGAGPLAAQVQSASQQPATAQPAAQSAYGITQGSGQPGQGSNANQSPPQSAPQGTPPQSATQPQPNSTTQGVQALGRGPLTLPMLVQAIKQRNPNISGRHLAAAVKQAMPILSMEGLQQYRGIEQQLRAQNEQSLIEDRRDRSADRKQAERDRLQMASDRIQAQNERQQESIKVRLQSLQQAKTLKEAQQSATALRSAIKDKLEATNHEIQMQYDLTDDQKAELYKQAQADAKTANDNLDKLLAEKGKGGTEGGKETGANNKENTVGAQAKPKVSDEQKAQWKKQAQDAIAAGKDAGWIKNKYKELTGEDLGQ